MAILWLNKSYSVKSTPFIFMTICVVAFIDASSINRTKRELFREQVLPASGGKIPETAFLADRLSLNKLNKEGYAIPDGIMLDLRRPVRHPYPYQELPETLKVYLTDDGRYVSIFGKYFTSQPEAIDTTYIIRTPVNINTNRQNFLYSHLESATQKYFNPILTPLTFPNNAIYDNPIKRTLSRVLNLASSKIIASESYERPRYHSTGKTQEIKTSEESFDSNLFSPGVFTHSGGIFKDMRIEPRRRQATNQRNSRKPLQNNTKT